MPALNLNLPSPLEKIEGFPFQCFIKRDDLIHPEVSGNKYRKLKYFIQELMGSKKKGIITFGGAFSNHIYAVAAYLSSFELPCAGIIRGEEDLENPTIQFATSKGMKIHFVNRIDYKNKNSIQIQNIITKYADYALLPEGGYHAHAMKGVGEVIDELELVPDYISCAVGTGATAAGLLTKIKDKGWPTKLLAFTSMKNSTLRRQILDLGQLAESDNLIMIEDFHLGGYAKLDKKLIDYHQRFFESTKIKLDPIYTLKMMYGIAEMSKANYFLPNNKVVIYHSGGLQGWNGYDYLKERMTR